MWWPGTEGTNLQNRRQTLALLDALGGEVREGFEENINHVSGKHRDILGKHLDILGKHADILGKHYYVLGKHNCILGKN